MRRRLLAAPLAVVAVSVFSLGLPLLVVTVRLVADNTRTELLARVRALLRRRTGDVLEASGVRMELASRRVWQDDVELHLSNKEYELLRVLLEEAGAVVTRHRIMREVWDDTEGGASKTLDMHVSWLRRKLGDDTRHPSLITTLRGRGLRFEVKPPAARRGTSRA